jgi:hypothetical protein
MVTYPLNPADANSQMALQTDAKAVTAFNRFLLAQFPDEWRSNYFAVGNSPSGDPYFLDLGSGSAAVWSWDQTIVVAGRIDPFFAAMKATAPQRSRGGKGNLVRPSRTFG